MPLTDHERKLFRSDDKKTAHAVWQGELLEITYLPRHKEYRRPGRRGVIKGFTRAARLRMLRTIASVNWSHLRNAVFITLTYPPSCENKTMSERNQDKYLFLRHMENHLGREVGGLWRAEWEVRKSGRTKGNLVSHFHLFAFGVRYIHKDTIKKWWKQVLGVKGPVVAWIDGVTSGQKVARYVSKYCSKLPESSVLDNASYLNKLGRHWGIHRRDKVPFYPRLVVPFLDQDEQNLADNLGAMTFRYFNRGAQIGFSCFGKNALKVGEILFNKMLVKESTPWYDA